MKKLNMSTIAAKAQNGYDPIIRDWGVAWLVDYESDAFKIAYAHRNAPGGVKVEHCPAVEKYLVTVFNKDCSPDIDRS